MPDTKSHDAQRSVPIHSLGISQIISYGLMFYVFAQLKTPLAEKLGVAESDILLAISGALLWQAILAPIVGGWFDRFGALYVMSRGLMIGAIGLGVLAFADHLVMVWVSMAFIGTGYAMATYEAAFTVAVQINERQSRRNISFITFYGGVASSVTWLTVAPLYLNTNLTTTILVAAIILLLMGVRLVCLSRNYAPPLAQGQGGKPAAFHWSILNRTERIALLVLAASSSLEYLVFTSTTLLWINWFHLQFNDLGLAVMLASIYGPFQVVGRVLEMRYGHRFDARITGALAYCCLPLALYLAQIESVSVAMMSMAIFGIGHGILTVTFGFVTNLFFRAEVYGRAKGWIVFPRGLGTALGPSIGGLLYLWGAGSFFALMISLLVVSGLSFLSLLALTPGNLHALD